MFVLPLTRVLEMLLYLPRWKQWIVLHRYSYSSNIVTMSLTFFFMKQRFATVLRSMVTSNGLYSKLMTISSITCHFWARRVVSE